VDNLTEHLEQGLDDEEVRRRVETLLYEYAYATECQMATLSRLCQLKSAAKSERRRQLRIVMRMVRVCKSMGVTSVNLQQCGRVKRTVNGEIDWEGRVEEANDQA